MEKKDIDAVLDRVRTWPPERQEDAARILLQMEEMGTGVYILSPEEEADIQEALAEEERGEFVSPEGVEALFRRLLKK